MKKNLLLPGLFLLIINVMFSQESKKEWVIGVVADELGHPMSRASILNKNTYSGDAVNENGVFELEMSDKDTLIISHIGYETEKRTLEEIKQNGLINMKSFVYGLEEVVVSAYGNDMKHYTMCCCMSIREENYEIPIAIGFQPRTWHYYPNPTKDFITINTFEQTGFIRLYAANGIELQKIQVTDDIVKIQVNDLPSGTYFLRYDRAGWGEIIGKFVKTD